MNVNLDSRTGMPRFDYSNTGEIGEHVSQIGILFVVVFLIYMSLGNNKVGWNLRTLGFGVILILVLMFIMYRYTNYNRTNSPSASVIVLLIVILFLILFKSLDNRQRSRHRRVEYDEYGEEIDMKESSSSKYLGIGTISIFFVILFTSGFTYLFNFDVVTSAKKIFSESPDIDFTVKSLNSDKDTSVPEITRIKQVYNIPDNKYTYKDAKALCKVYGSRLANYKDLKKAYDEGANWCSYGWSANQAALFPTQYKTWKNLQKIKGHENDCGRPGINGGYIGDKNAKFGVNCFGHKPKINPLESQLMQERRDYPISHDEIEFNKRVDYWRTKVKDILVAPFNNNNWSMI